MPSVNNAFPSKWIKPEDFEGKEMVLTIEDVVEDYQKNRDTGVMEPRLNMLFRGYPKILTLNKTNANMLVELLESDDTDDWKGAAITLYVTSQMIGNERKKVIRVKDYLPAVKAAPAKAQRTQQVAAPADPFGDGPPDDEDIPF